MFENKRFCFTLLSDPLWASLRTLMRRVRDAGGGLRGNPIREGRSETSGVASQASRTRFNGRPSCVPSIPLTPSPWLLDRGRAPEVAPNMPWFQFRWRKGRRRLVGVDVGTVMPGSAVGGEI